MNVRLHERWEDIQELSAAWNALLAQSASDTLFLTWEWTEAWWKNYGAGRSLFVLSAWNGDTLEGLAPLYLDPQSHWGRRWNCLRLIGDGSGDSDYLDCVARRGSEPEVMAAFVEFLEEHRSRWDFLEFHGTPETSPCLAALRNASREKSWKLSSEPIPCATLPLPHDWNAYLKQLKPRFRTKVRSVLAYFDEQLAAAPVACQDAAEAGRWLPILFDLHTRRWQTKNQPGVFHSEEKQGFYRDISRATLERGWLAFHRLDWGERPLALQYGFHYGNRFFLLQEGYDPDFAALRPGLALRGWLLRHWIESGLAEYDFLAGVSSYKLDWGAQRKQSVRLLLAPSPRAAWIAFGAAQAREGVKEAVRAVVPDSILAWRDERIKRRVRPQMEVPPQLQNGHRSSLSRRAAATLYAATPLGAVGRAFASRYELDAERHRLRPRRVPLCQIFIYHRVNDDFDSFLPSVPVAAFRKQMEFLKKNFPIVSLDEIGHGAFPDNGANYCAALTFDDGYRDNFLSAFPVLKDLGLPATVFLTTGYIEAGELPWYDQVCWGFKLTTRERLSLKDVGGPEGRLDLPPERLKVMGQTLAWLRGLEETDRLRLTPQVFAALHVPAFLRVPSPMLNWDEIRQMSKQNVTFGAHTVSHPALSRVNGERLEAEISGSRDRIQEELQLPVRHFAYPFGQPRDIGAEARSAVQRAGFATAVTTVWGFNRPGDDLLELKRFSPRFNPWDFDPGRFAMMLDWYRLAGVQQQEDSHQQGATA
jgi:CelD/BcsL family acetyltransferase involved in cellulose biosynthesis/peptidoglycan/xylan/chitin deacetylase (PgdA/CDA1 family)